MRVEPQDGVSVLIKKAPRAPRPLHRVRTQPEDGIYKPGSESSPDIKTGTLIDPQQGQLSDFPVPSLTRRLDHRTQSAVQPLAASLTSGIGTSAVTAH